MKFLLMLVAWCLLLAIASTGVRSLKEGKSVSFEVVQGPKGKQAANVAPA